ncbi:liprin-alpha-1-like isoform X3 [Moschus berezovskii]|uniref:liprin-alpha-1-like isoform X3 n=1 Tax=Moschus berezovskii TaxID=68408 RepID=UPI002444F4BA|nr:liprin-alpha-1-like isoform X3 [Moschus berezovskii]
MTAGKQQEQPPASMTSELEVLRALKFLFDHHKSLDEKRSSDGSLSHKQNLAKMSELQEVIDKQSREQSQMKERLAALSAHVRELEEDLDTARKKLLKSEEVNRKLERNVREARQGGDVKEEHNKRMADLEDKVQTLKEQGWARVQQASMLANVAQAFESDEGVSDGEGDGVTLFSSATQLSPSGQNDAETPTVMLQGQLDAINEEIRLIEEKNTEQSAEETESSVGSGSLGNLRHFIYFLFIYLFFQLVKFIFY